ncbi:IS4 family transposase [Halalkalibacter alkalisediminis]|uniref:Transposase n=1 Tax=Halalkalibacter alkalisediminis TaxID=935616 RepID=A0ABV6NN45_9BACI
MLSKKSSFVHLSQAMKNSFSELNVGKHLRHAGITKKIGFSCLSIFQLLFLLVFEHRNWYQAGLSKQAVDLPGKDAIYRFLKVPTFNWRKFLSSLSSEVIQRFQKLTSSKRVSVFILDDSVYSRNRSKNVELLSRIHDHVTHKFVKGFSLLTLGWSDGFSFVPVDFALLSSAKKTNRFCEMDSSIDKRTSGFKRRMEAIQSKPEVAAKLIQNALDKGVMADYVLMDTWFTHAPLIESITGKGLFVIGMVKQMKQRYRYNDKLLKLEDLFKVIKPNLQKKDVLGSIQVCLQTDNQTPVKIVFVRNRNKKSEWLAILSTDTAISDDEMVRIYGMRWDIETFFKCTKSLLKLAKEVQGRSYDSMINHTTLVFTRYILLEWNRRNEQDPKTIGHLFFLMCEEVKDLDMFTALQQLLELFETMSKGNVSLSTETLSNQLAQWFESLPSYIKGLLSFSMCES